VKLYNLSDDGLIRLWTGALMQIHLQHLFSGLDNTPDAQDSLSEQISGYTEWRSPGTPAVSVGWDWTLRIHTHRARSMTTCQRQGLPRSNLMLLDAQGRDLGLDNTSLYLAQWVDVHAARNCTQGGLPWQHEILTKYAPRMDYSPAAQL
jgi:hypothetical protein